MGLSRRFTAVLVATVWCVSACNGASSPASNAGPAAGGQSTTAPGGAAVGAAGTAGSTSQTAPSAPAAGTTAPATGNKNTSTTAKPASPLPPPWVNGKLYYGRITSFTTDGAHIQVALCLYFNGPDVNQQAAKYGVKTPVPNDYFTVDEHKTVSVDVPASVQPSLVQGGMSNQLPRAAWGATMEQEASAAAPGYPFKPLFVMTFQHGQLASLAQIFTP
jgi:hypothetical protein